MMRQWPCFWGVARDNKEWYKDGRAEIALHPAGPAGSKTWWGGWGFSLPKFSKNLDAAKDLIAWVTNNKNAPVLAEGQSWFVMPRKSILDVMKEGLPVHMQQYTDANAFRRGLITRNGRMRKPPSTTSPNCSSAAQPGRGSAAGQRPDQGIG
jgi:ABC-type glycerol-3-phosphate transport system substrate-binding protein